MQTATAPGLYQSQREAAAGGPCVRLVYSFIRRRVSQGSQAIRPYSSVLLGRSRNNENKREQKTRSQSQHPNIKHFPPTTRFYRCGRDGPVFSCPFWDWAMGAVATGRLCHVHIRECPPMVYNAGVVAWKGRVAGGRFWPRLLAAR